MDPDCERHVGGKQPPLEGLNEEGRNLLEPEIPRQATVPGGALLLLYFMDRFKKDFTFSSQRAAAMLGFQAAVGLEDGVKRTAD